MEDKMEDKVYYDLPRVKHMLNAHAFEKNHEVNVGPSMTVPDQNMSIPEILERYARGLPLGGGQGVPMYDEDDETPDPRTMDLTEIQEEMFEIKDRLAKARDHKEKMDLDKKLKKLMDDEKKREDVPEKSPGENGDKL